MEFMLWIWVGIVAVTAIIEFATVQMVSIWFTIGGIGAIVAYACDAEYWVQIIVFVLVSLIMLLCFRKISMKWILRNVKEKTNSEAIVGQQVRLLTDVTDDDEGSAQIGDVIWSVVGKDGFTAQAGTRVKVIKIDGNKLVVEAIE